MLFLLLRIGDEGYAVAASRIVEILPLVEIKRMRATPPEVAGSFRYRGAFVPAIDLDRLELGRPAPVRMGTRILVVDVPGNSRSSARERIGLIAAGATETLRYEASAFTPFASGPHGLVQRLDIDKLLSPQLRELLFARGEEAA